MYTYIYIYINHTFTHTHICTYTYTYIYICTSIYAFTRIKRAIAGRTGTRNHSNGFDYRIIYYEIISLKLMTELYHGTILQSYTMELYYGIIFNNHITEF